MENNASIEMLEPLEEQKRTIAALQIELQQKQDELSILKIEREHIDNMKALEGYIISVYGNELDQKSLIHLIDLCAVEGLKEKDDKKIHDIYRRIKPALSVKKTLKNIFKR